MTFVHVKQEVCVNFVGTKNSTVCLSQIAFFIPLKESYSGSDFLQSSLKQEEEESDLISEQILNKTGKELVM